MKKTEKYYTDRKTILVVDDETALLDFVKRVLLDGNYNVLSAISGVAALEQAQDYGGEIDLLLSDFQMDGMNGIDLATAISIERPRIQILLMSGFVGGMLVLNEGWHFLPKPFIASQLRLLVAGLVSPERDSKLTPYPVTRVH